MPSPLGHALGGLAAGLLVGPAPTRRVLALAATAAVLPDVDFLWGRHSMETHSLGAALLAGIVVLAGTGGRARRLAGAVALAWASHVLFDWLGSDDTLPLGVMAWWPWSADFTFGHRYVFEAISRRYWRPGFVLHNLRAVAWELVLLGPLVAGLAAGRRWLARRQAGVTAGTGSST